jgi:hypothetical protein
MLSYVHHWVGFNSYQSFLRIHEMIDKVSEQRVEEGLERTKEIWLSLLEGFEAFLKQFQQIKAPTSHGSILNHMHSR